MRESMTSLSAMIPRSNRSQSLCCWLVVACSLFVNLLTLVPGHASSLIVGMNTSGVNHGS